METEKFLCDLILFVDTIKKMPPGNYKNELLNSAKTMAEKLYAEYIRQSGRVDRL